MSNIVECQNPGCLNKGKLVFDANSVFFLIEGVIQLVEDTCTELRNKEDRLPRILDYLDDLLTTIEDRCSSNGVLYTSELVFNEEITIFEGKEFKGINKFNARQQRQLSHVLKRHFPQLSILTDEEIVCVSSFFLGRRPTIDRDASLLAAACQLTADGSRAVVLTTDQHFDLPIKKLVRRGSISLAGGSDLSTAGLVQRHYFHFIRSLHECCRLDSKIYRSLGDAYFAAQFHRIPNLSNKSVLRRVVRDINELFSVHTMSLQYKCQTDLSVF